jgi:hypothetical protein
MKTVLFKKPSTSGRHYLQRALMGAIVGVVGLAALSAQAESFDDPSVANYWYSYQQGYGPGGTGVYVNPTVSGGYASWALPVNGAPVGASVSTRQNWLFVYDDTGDPGAPAMTRYNGTLLGDLSSKTAVTATFRLSLSTPAGSTLDPSQMWYSTPGALPTVRFMFEAYDPALFAGTGVDPDLHWWSNPGAVGLTTMANGTDYTLTVNLDPALWSNDYGAIGTHDGGVAFHQTLASVLDLGLSFGGGSGFQNGFALMPGANGSFDLSELSTVPEPTSLVLVAFALGGLVLIRKRK